jgi:hypothetical protein
VRRAKGAGGDGPGANPRLPRERSFDLRNRDSFLAATNAVAELRLRAGEDQKPPAKVVFAGNFADLASKKGGGCEFQKAVDSYVKKHKDVVFVAVSAKTSDGLGTLLTEILRIAAGGGAGGGEGEVQAQAMQR